MKSFWKKFFEPMRGEMKPVHFVLIIIGSLGQIPASYFARYVDNFWLFIVAFILWWIFVVFSYLTICHIKNKIKNSKIEIK